MSTVSIKNLAFAIYESSLNKTDDDLDLIMRDSAKLIACKNLLSKSEQILSTLENIIDKEKGIVRAKISFKTKITKKNEGEIIDFIKKKYKAREVIIELKENPKTLGGIKIEIEDEIIDTTLRYKLNQLQNYLITTE